jgi:hypothetical protein
LLHISTTSTKTTHFISTPSLTYPFHNLPLADPNPADFEHHKQDSLAKQKKGQGHWKPELASVSEETVKADRMGPHEADEAAMKRLQDQTKGSAEETAKHGTSMRDGL